MSAIFMGWILLAFAVPVCAAGDEEIVARNFLKFLGSDKAILSAEVLQGSLLDPPSTPVVVGHLFHLDGGGYLLVSPDRSISPVKAYSLSGDFAVLPGPYRRALLQELELRVRVAPAGAGQTPLFAEPSETQARWDFLLGYDATRTPLSAYTPGEWLIRTKWNQDYPFNKYLPAVGGQTVMAGCVNVAVAQVMRYYGYPVSSKGVTSYLWDGPPPQTLKTILYRGYNWNNMPETLGANTPEYQVDEVALLLKDLGIANRTNFDVTGSSTSIRTAVLTENFGYSTGLSHMDNAAFPAFLTTLKGEIDAGHPLLFSFVGQHMTVADGYSADNAGQRIHINMGWGGSADDFYFLDYPVHPSVSAGGYSFPTDAGKLAIYYNIKPCSAAAGDCAVNLEAGDAGNGLVITGRFNQAKDADLYDVYLNGPTTIRGERGYSNLALYMSISSAADGSIVFPCPDPQTTSSAATVFDAGSLPAGKYTVRVSLCSETGFCYGLNAYDSYTVTITSGSLTPEEKAAIDQGLDRPPVIGNAFPDLLLNTGSGTRKILIDARDENGDSVALSVANSNPAAVGAVLNGNILEITPTGAAKVSSRIAVAATANGRTVEKSFAVMTDSGDTAFGTSFAVGGTFTGQSDIRTHRAILDGVCTITGSTVGYSNQGFFSSVRSTNGTTLVPPDDITISGTFAPAVYLLDASLLKSNKMYPYKTGDGDQYLLSVSCPAANGNIAVVAPMLGISLAGANLPIVRPGDVDGNGAVTLTDAVLALQIMGGIDTTGKTIYLQADANGDAKIGLAELILILQKAAGLRN